jgi:WD40 repeat protein
VFERIHQAEQVAQEKANFTTAFASSDWTLRLAAVEQLAQVEREIALPWLERAISDEHPSVRAWAVHVAGQHQLSALIRSTLSDPDWQVREATELSLKGQDAPLSEHIPLEVQDDPDTVVSQAARELFHQPPPHFYAGGKSQMIPTTDQPTHPLSLERNQYEPGTLQSSQQRPHHKRSRLFWSLIAASVALLIVLGNLVALRFLGQQSSQTTTASKHSLGSTLYTHSFPRRDKDSNNDIQLGTLAWSPNGQRLAIAAGPMSHGSVYIWDALTGAHEVVLAPSRSTNPAVDPEVYATQVAWAPDGTFLASAIGDVQIWNPSTGALVKRLFPNVSSTSTVNQIAWSPDGHYLAGGFNSSDGTQGIAIWNVGTGELVKTLSANVGNLAWSPNGQYLAMTGDGAKVVIWNTSNWNRIQNIPLQAGPLAWSPDSTRLAVGTLSGSVKILAISTGKVVLTYQGQDQQGSQALAWSSDGKRIVSASSLSIQIWSATSGLKLFTYTGQTGNEQGNPSLGDLVWSPDGQYAASSTRFGPNPGGGGAVQVWQAV